VFVGVIVVACTCVVVVVLENVVVSCTCVVQMCGRGKYHQAKE
jgi:hypothetical protein